MARYARGYIKQDSHDSLISDVATDVTTNTSAIAANTASIATKGNCVMNIVTGSRSLGSVYQNTNDTMMDVVVTITHSAVAAGQIASNIAYVEAGDTTPDTAVAQITTNYVATAVIQQLVLSFHVPAGSYYSVSDSDSGGGTSTKSIWVEWVHT